MERNRTKFLHAAKPPSIKFLSYGQKFYRGFTLLEVMVAMAILATALTAVLKLHADSIELLTNSRTHAKGAHLAQFKMTEIEVLGLDKLPFRSGDFGDLAPDYAWEIQTEPTALPEVTKVTVVVGNKHLRRGGRFELVEYIMSGPIEKAPPGLLDKNQ